jgi:hypothetical protein
MAQLGLARAEFSEDLGDLLGLDALSAEQRVEFLAPRAHRDDLLPAYLVFRRRDETTSLSLVCPISATRHRARSLSRYCSISTYGDLACSLAYLLDLGLGNALDIAQCLLGLH